MRRAAFAAAYATTTLFASHISGQKAHGNVVKKGENKWTEFPDSARTVFPSLELTHGVQQSTELLCLPRMLAGCLLTACQQFGSKFELRTNSTIRKVTRNGE